MKSSIPPLRASQSGSPVDPVTFGSSTARRPGVTLPSSCTNAARGRAPRRLRLRALSELRLRFWPDLRLTPIRFWSTFPCFVITVPTTRYCPGASDRLKRPLRPTGRAAATVPVARLTARIPASAPFGTLMPIEPANVPGLADASAAASESATARETDAQTGARFSTSAHPTPAGGLVLILRCWLGSGA